MGTYQFLSDDWISQARKIREEFEDKAGNVPHQIRMNLVVTEVPFGSSSLDAHLDSSDGQLRLDLGHIEPVDLKVTLDYVTAKAILVEGNPQAGMQAFMSGKIKVEGDMSKLMAMQATPPDPAAAEVASRLRAITS